jgi:hypothetical protein
MLNVMMMSNKRHYVEMKTLIFDAGVPNPCIPYIMVSIFLDILCDIGSFKIKVKSAN